MAEDLIYLQEIADFLSDIVQVNSESGNENELAKRLVFAFDSLGAEAYIDRVGNVFAKIGSGDIIIVFNAHLDTVEIGAREQWEHDPLSGYFDGEYVWGRGSVDMKGAIASIYFTFRELIESKEDILNEVSVIFAGVLYEEPAEGAAFEAFLKENEIEPDLVVICEPSSLNLIDAQRGRIEFLVRTSGDSAHAAFPTEGANAVYRAANIIKKIEDYANQLSNRASGKRGSLAITGIKSYSVSKNAVPYLCEFIIDRRLDIGESKESAEDELCRIIKEGDENANIEITGYRLKTYTGYDLEGENYFPSWKEDDRNIKGVIEEAYREVFKMQPQWKKWNFGTDGSISKGVMGYLTIGFGPGTPEKAHRVNEKIKVKEVELASQFYSNLVKKIQKTYIRR